MADNKEDSSMVDPVLRASGGAISFGEICTLTCGGVSVEGGGSKLPSTLVFCLYVCSFWPPLVGLLATACDPLFRTDQRGRLE
jgi:hypothetical protein